MNTGESDVSLEVQQSHTQLGFIGKEALLPKYRFSLWNIRVWQNQCYQHAYDPGSNLLVWCSQMNCSWVATNWRDYSKNYEHAMKFASKIVPISVISPRDQKGRCLLSLKRLHGKIAEFWEVLTFYFTSDETMKWQQNELLVYLVSFLMSVGSQISVMLNSDEPKNCIRTAEVSMLVQRHMDKPLNGIFFSHLEHHGLSKKLTSKSSSWDQEWRDSYCFPRRFRFHLRTFIYFMCWYLNVNIHCFILISSLRCSYILK